MATKRGRGKDASRQPEDDPAHQPGDAWSRRRFVQTSGGVLLAAAGVGACSNADGPEPQGQVTVTIIGLAPGLTSGGSVLVTRTDKPQDPVSIPLPNLTTATVTVPAGTYHVIYTPPSGYQVTGTNEFDITVIENQTTTVNVTVTLIATQGTLRCVVTGLSGAASGGSASALRTDIGGQTPVVIPVPVAGSVDTVVAAGTYTVTYTAPAGFSVSAGVTNPVVGLVIGVGATVSATFAVTVAAGFQPPNVLNNLSFEANLDGLTGGGGVPNLLRVNTQAFDGAFSLSRVWSANASDVGGSNFFVLPATYDELWMRFYIRLAAGWNITTIMKFALFREAGFGTQFGGFELGGPNASAGRPGLSWSSFQEQGAVGVQIVSVPNLTADTWHAVEVHNRRNGDAFPNYAFWFDGQQVTKPDGADPIGNGWTWAGGRLVSSQRGTSAKMGILHYCGILNGGNTGSGTVWLDSIAASTAGRIGP